MKISKDILRNAPATLVALALFLVISIAYFAPQFGGDVLPQHDVMQFDGMSKDIVDMNRTTGEDPQWTGNMFSGMPAYLIYMKYPGQLVKHTIGAVAKVIDLPAGFMVLAMLSFWLMLLMMKCRRLTAIVPAIAYGLSTYFLLIIDAGHITKMWALVYAPVMMGGAWLTLRGNMWYGGVITAVATSLEIGANHPQITYYFLMAMGFMWLAEGLTAWRDKAMKAFSKRTAVLLAAGILAVMSNFSSLWYTAQHTPDTIRGGSELAATARSDSREGLDLDYATAWSYGIDESLTLLVPDFMGRRSGEAFSPNGKVAQALHEIGMRGGAEQLPSYWGTQPYSGGPTYLGAAALFLAVMGVMLARVRNCWWILAVSLLMLLLAWGRNMMWFTELAFRILPGYDKFRTVSMTLVIVQWAVPLLGAFSLMHLVDRETESGRMKKALLYALSLTGGVCLLLAVAGPSLFNFGRSDSTEMMTQQFHHMLQSGNMQQYIDRGLDIEWGEKVGEAMAAERADMMQADALRSLLMVLLAAGSVALYCYRKVGRHLLLAMLGGVMLLDLMPVDMRFLSHDNFVSPRHNTLQPTAADKEIMADKEPGFRVMNYTVSPFQDATTSYFHRSVGGYHGAKLSRYQDLIDNYLSDIDRSGEILDMLNTKYFIVPDKEGHPRAVKSETANGAAWFVQNILHTSSPREEIDALGDIDTSTTAVVDDTVDTKSFGRGSITLTEYRPNYLKYTCSSPEGGTAIFSEIYYDKGWKAYVDGREHPYFRADYVLRGMELPAGEHVVEWKFRAPGWAWVDGVTMAASVLILLGAAWAIINCIKKKN